MVGDKSQVSIPLKFAGKFKLRTAFLNVLMTQIEFSIIKILCSEKGAKDYQQIWMIMHVLIRSLIERPNFIGYLDHTDKLDHLSSSVYNILWSHLLSRSFLSTISEKSQVSIPLNLREKLKPGTSLS